MGDAITLRLPPESAAVASHGPAVGGRTTAPALAAHRGDVSYVAQLLEIALMACLRIEVTFEVDASGILTVSAQDKGTGKKEKITITAEKGRLSQEEIERMVREAEEFADQDKAIEARVDARNQLETYLYNMKSSVEDKLKDKIEDEDKEKIGAAVKEALERLDEHPDAEAEEYKEVLKAVEDVCGPIIAQVYQRGGGEASSGADEDLGDHDEL
ncbi:hypothetical protein HYH03_007774 [Edaphochlamys debaryana]|uniref:Uncharacterized protein n=1 Tax=Edaphochlamys debaryana TaxID=47281 RepID=A0A835Y4S0_9CHLO|nr:hypothetical protein HYH03_007774 [Edaphochlamys debaryana]|eukprot:KAG2494136.1 hypothetical protein HYH03_007774 [Edaphochlamys debaryana]